jgi:hypothetical protein
VGKVSIIAYGPSLLNTWTEITYPIVSMSGSHDFLVSRGIVPDFHVEFDKRSHKAKHIRKPQPQTKYLIATRCHPDVFHRLRNSKVIQWDHYKQGRGNCVGLRAITLFYELGYREFDVHGLDSSFSDDTKVQWAGPHFGRSRFKRDIIAVKCGGRWFKTSVAFANYVDEFLEIRASLKDATIRLHGDGLMQQAAKETL